MEAMASATEASMANSYGDRMFAFLTERLTGGPDESGHVEILSPQGAVVKAAGRPDVRVTMKAEAVSMKDVEDFEGEVASAGGHGIICGVDCAVAQRSAVGFRLIKPGGGFVFHLANVGDDADMVVEYLRVIYGLESRRGAHRLVCKGEYDEVLTTGVRWVQEICKRYVDRVEVTKVARTMGAAKAAMEAGLRAVYDISLMLPREATAPGVAEGVVKAEAPPRSASATLSAARGYIVFRGLAGCDGVKDDGGDGEVRQYMCKWCKGVSATDGDVKRHIKVCGLRKVALDFAQGGALLITPQGAVRGTKCPLSDACVAAARESGTTAASGSSSKTAMHANVTGVRAARGYDLIKVDGVRRYECKWCGGVRASGDDIKKHLRTCSAKGEAKIKVEAEARVVADEAAEV